MKKLSLLVVFCPLLVVAQLATVSPKVVATPIALTLTLNPPVIAVGQASTIVAQYLMSDGTLNAIVTSQCSAANGWSSGTPAVANVVLGVASGLTSGSSVIGCTLPASGTVPILQGSITLTVGASPQITNPPAGCTQPCLLPAATNGTAYSDLLQATGGTAPYTWTVTAGTLPTGLSLTSTGCGTNVSCNIAGTPTVNGTQVVTIRVTDSLAANTSEQMTITVNASALCGTPPNYCARQDTTVSSGSTVNAGKPPAALMGLNCAVAGACAAADAVLDDNNTGPAIGWLSRVNDYTMNLAFGGFCTDNSSSTSRQWNINGSGNSTIFLATCNSKEAFFAFAAGNPPTITPKGTAIVDVNGNTIQSGSQWSGNPCSIATCGTNAATSFLFYTTGGSSTFPARQVILGCVLDTANAAWTGSTGANQNLAAAINCSTVGDPILAAGLTSYMTGTQEGPYWNKWMAAAAADVNDDKLDHVSAQAMRFSQDMSSIIITKDSTQTGNGLRWIDLKTGQVCGSYGPCGSTTGFGPLPPPAAPTVALLTTGGSLDCTQKYSVWQTYEVMGRNNNSGGDGSLGGQTIVGPNGTGSTCLLQVQPPNSWPGGGTGINLWMKPTGYNNYACVWINNNSCAFLTVPSLQNNVSWQSAGQRGPDFVNCSPSPCRNITFAFAQGIATPSLSGSSMRFDVGGTVGYGDAFFNNHLIGDQSSIGLPDTNRTFVPTLHNFAYDVYFYGTNLALSQALEFDVNQFFSSMGFIWGFQCQIAGTPTNTWYIWDNVNGTWFQPTGNPTCNPVSNAWNHLTLTVSRVQSDQSLLYKTITLNGFTQTLNYSVPHGSAPSNFYGVTINYQEDGNSIQSAYSIYLDNLIFGYGQ